jgi:hypothetical protein
LIHTRRTFRDKSDVEVSLMMQKKTKIVNKLAEQNPSYTRL